MTAHNSSDPASEPDSTTTGRRRFLGYLLAAPTLVAAAELGSELTAPATADAAVPSPPQPAEIYDLNDMLTDAARPTSNLITVQVNGDGTVSFALPRAEVGQGITTSTAMIIAEEMDIAVDEVHITLADARPELVFNQLTGGSNTTIATFNPIRVAASIAKGRLLQAASAQLDEVVSKLTPHSGVISAPDGRSVSYGELAEKAATERTRRVSTELKSTSDFSVIGKPRNRIDAHDIVTGRKVFATDMKVPDALPTMVCRPPRLKASVESVANLDEVREMPGITDVVPVSTGVAVRGRTFGQCIDAVRALEVSWGEGSIDGESDESVLRKVKAGEIPLAVPDVDPLAKTVEADFTFYFNSNSALEPNSAIADVKPDRAEIWSGLKVPIAAQGLIAKKLGLPQNAVTVHVTEGGGSFGRKLFHDAAIEAAEISQRIGKPVKLMWHRTDDSRHGRTHPMNTSRIRVSYAGDDVLTYEQRHTSVATDFTHGLGEIVTAMAAKLPPGVANLTLSESIFALTQHVPYEFGVADQLLNEVYSFDDFATGSMRNVYSPNVTCARELIVDRLAAEMDKDPCAFRREFFKDDRSRAVLDKVAEVGEWGKEMPPGTAQGIGFHAEYYGMGAVLVEIDCRPETVHRDIRDAVSGPRVTRAVAAVDVGLPVNPRGLEAQMMGCLMDGIALTLTSSLHLEDGLFLEGSWDDYFYTRQWNVPPETDIIVMPPTTGEPGGAGELGVASSMAAVACAYARATGEMPTSFPINHHTLSFDPKPKEPPIPQSPTDGLKYTY